MKTLLFIITVLSGSCLVKAQLPVVATEDQKALLRSDDPQLQENKKLVYNFWLEVFQTRDMEKAPEYMTEDYMQHNPLVETGRKPFTDFFGKFEKLPAKDRVDNLVSIVAEGDKVVMVFRRELPEPGHEGGTYTTTWFDMFRIEDGKIAEHWDAATK